MYLTGIAKVPRIQKPWSCAHKTEKQQGGPGSIAEQMVDHNVDILLGGGEQRFNQTIDAGTYSNQTVIDSAKSQGYSVITTASELADLQSLENNATNSTSAWSFFSR